jgi:hypothetical protein
MKDTTKRAVINTLALHNYFLHPEDTFEIEQETKPSRLQRADKDRDDKKLERKNRKYEYNH